MDKLLIIYAHPNHEGHNAYLLKTISANLEKNKIDFEILDLYKMSFNPCLLKTELFTMGQKNISEENLSIQEKIRNTDKLLFIYPTWWQNMPAIMKGFFDRILTPGFAYEYKNTIPHALLKNKKAAIFTTTGGPAIYEKYLIMSPSIRLVKKHILAFCGIKSRGFMLCSAKHLEDNKEKIEKISRKIIKYLF